MVKASTFHTANTRSIRAEIAILRIVKITTSASVISPGIQFAIQSFCILRFDNTFSNQANEVG